MQDIGEFLVAGELSFAGIPIKMAPPNCENYDLIAYPDTNRRQLVSVKCRRINGGSKYADFRKGKSDWIAIVIVDDSPRRRFFIVPHQEALKAKASRPPPASWSRVWRRIYIPFVPTVFAAYEDNFRLKL